MNTERELVKAKEPPFLESLSFQGGSPGGSPAAHASTTMEEPRCADCLLCEKSFNVGASREDCLRHLVLTHKLVIGDVKLIADFERYLDYWRQRFKEKPLTEFCTVIQTNSKETDVGPKEFYYLLCDALPEDKELRMKLQQEKLRAVLEQQQAERSDATFCRTCLFCKEHFEGNRAELFNHMAHEHAFNVGLPDNLVYTGEFLDILQQKLRSLQCLYCEKTFKDKPVLKEHMRKKQHRKINPKNPIYDKFYVINYLELGKNWESLQSEDDDVAAVTDDSDDNSSVNKDDWGEWQDMTGAQAVCLFCTTSSAQVDQLIQHMKDAHKFDLRQLKSDLSLSFYQQVKLINYIRRQVYQNACLNCQQILGSREELLNHLEVKGHASDLPDPRVWDQPQYFFPTYEDDNLLCALDDDEEDDDLASGGATGKSVVIAEDLPVQNSILAAEAVRRQLLS